MFDSINLMLPSYKRPDMLRRFVDSAFSTAKKPESLCFTFMTNDKDASYDNFKWPERSCVLRESSTEPNLSAYFNAMFADTAFSDPNIACSMLGDDMVFETQGWDVAVINQLNEADGVAVVHCEDGFCSHGAIPVNLFVARKFVEAMGVPFMCPYYKRYYMDEAYAHIADSIDANYFLFDVMIRHDHTSGKTWDETYARLQDLDGEFGDTKAMWLYVNQAVRNILRSGLL